MRPGVLVACALAVGCHLPPQSSGDAERCVAAQRATVTAWGEAYLAVAARYNAAVTAYGAARAAGDDAAAAAVTPEAASGESMVTLGHIADQWMDAPANAASKVVTTSRAFIAAHPELDLTAAAAAVEATVAACPARR